MAAEAGQPAPKSEAPAEKKDQGDQKKGAKDQSKAPAAVVAASEGGEKKLSNAELKKKAKEEKAARRAAAKVTQPQPPASAPGQGDSAKGGKSKPKQDGPQAGAQHGKTPAPRSAAPMTAAAPKEAKPSVPECFSHLAMAKGVNLTHADKDVHPAVLLLGQQMSTMAISDSTTRLEATLLAFKKLLSLEHTSNKRLQNQVIDSYTTPHGTTLSRHFTSHVLNPQIVYLTACRPMCFSMGNAIRWLKLQISKIDIDMADSDAKKLLCEAIDSFIHERITLADLVIVNTAADMIAQDDVILTYAHHHLVERALLKAKASGKRFKVILVDDPFERVGLDHVKKLAAAGIPVAYSPDFGALRTNLQESTTVLVAAEAMFSNGAMYARAGTCDVATAAFDLGMRVTSLCETINFTERVSIDSLTYNEIDPERNTDEEFRLLFDTTRDKSISAVVTELGICSAKSVPAILRKLEEL
ncbi:putative translation initiation factor eIF-2B subunit delta [Trichoderma lentiforme]|uniref:Translation initiation factor eIF2B subunit delta n=1 Tax=Trichoderma lentiforme TaxID=1567552 RepID=A0A9P4X6V9_9HYPO|nr:putative translation initiation factor eIF-2B subunit delta [Trichoderma lentiforme]